MFPWPPSAERTPASALLARSPSLFLSLSLSLSFSRFLSHLGKRRELAYYSVWVQGIVKDENFGRENAAHNIFHTILHDYC